jgi:hypothetical protein
MTTPGAGELVSIGAEGDTTDLTRVVAKHGELLLGEQVPKSYRTVHATACQRPSVGREGGVGDSIRVAGKRGDRLTIFCVPGPHEPIGAGGRQGLAVAAKLDGSELWLLDHRYHLRVIIKPPNADSVTRHNGQMLTVR